MRRELSRIDVPAKKRVYLVLESAEDTRVGCLFAGSNKRIAI